MGLAASTTPHPPASPPKPSSRWRRRSPHWATRWTSPPINTRTRFIEIKEQQAEIAKRELDVLWHDYFKPEHLEKYPNLHDTFWKATKLCSKNKTEQDPANGEALMQTIEEIHKMFWATKGRDVPFYRAS